MTPKDGSLSALQTAALLFEEARVRELVAFEALPAVISADREPALELRAGRALIRLEAMIGGAWRPNKRPRTAADVRLVAEEVYDLATQRMQGAAVGSGTHGAAAAGGSHGMGSLVDLIEDRRSEQPPMELKAAQAAVPAAVAARLSAQKAEVAAAVDASDGNPAAAMQAITDTSLRKDLARVMAGNGKVHAPGESDTQKRRLSSHCHSMRESLLMRVIAKLIARGGKAGKAAAGMQLVTQEKAWPLAEAAMAGNFDWDAYVKLSKHIRGPAAAASGTAREVAETFALVRACWASVIEACYPVDDDAMEDLATDVSETAQAQAGALKEQPAMLKDHADMLLDYVKRLLSSFALMVTTFRKGGEVMPSVSAVVSMHREDWSLLCQMAAVWKNLPKQQRQPGGGKGAGGKPGGGGRKPDEEGEQEEVSKAKRRRENQKLNKERKEKDEAVKATAAGAVTAPATATKASWVSKPKFDATVWQGICDDYRTQFPGHCSWFGLTKCKNTAADCKGKHELPTGFKAFCDEAEKLKQ